MPLPRDRRSIEQEIERLQRLGDSITPEEFGQLLFFLRLLENLNRQAPGQLLPHVHVNRETPPTRKQVGGGSIRAVYDENGKLIAYPRATE